VNTALCLDHHEIFDSTDPRDHALAAEFCAVCPIAETCARELEAVLAHAPYYGRPEGTWAGRLIADANGRNARKRAYRAERRAS
jgi:hypothetical protein